MKISVLAELNFMFSKILSHRRKIFDVYLNELSKNKNIHCVNDLDNKKKHAAWLFTIVLEKKDFLQKDIPHSQRKNIGLQAVFKSVFPIFDFNKTALIS